MDALVYCFYLGLSKQPGTSTIVKSINNVSSEGEGRGYQKWRIWAIFKARTGTTGGGLKIQNEKKRRLWMFAYNKYLHDLYH